MKAESTWAAKQRTIPSEATWLAVTEMIQEDVEELRSSVAGRTAFSNLAEGYIDDGSSKNENDKAEVNSHDRLPDLSPANVRQLISIWSTTPNGGEQFYDFFMQIVAITHEDSMQDRRMTVVCNAISMLLKEAFRSSSGLDLSIQQLQEMWIGAFSVTKRVLQTGKTKPALQVLDMLLSSLHKSLDLSTSDLLRTNALRDQLHIIVLGGSVGAIKGALTVLAHVLRREQSYNAFLFAQASALAQREPQKWAERLANHGITRFKMVSDCEGATPLFLSLFLALPQHETRHAAMRLLTLCCEKLSEIRTADHYSALKQTMELYISSGSSHVSFQDIFPAVFVDAGQFQMFFESFYGPLSHARLLLLLDALISARKSYGMTETKVSLILQEVLSGSTPMQEFEQAPFMILLGNGEPEIRATTLGLLLFSRATSEPVPDNVLLVVVQNLDHIFDDGDAHYRGEATNIFAKLVRRLNDSFSKLERLRQDGQHQTLQNFLEHFVQKMLSYLGPSHTYQRHILTLQILQHVLAAPKLLLYLRDIDAFSETYQRSLCCNLLSLVMDPFEDVRDLAWTMLRSVSTQVTGDQAHPSFRGLLAATTTNLLPHLERLAACSARSDHADGLGRIHSLQISHEKLAFIVSRLTNYLDSLRAFELPTLFPLHGLLLAVRHAMSTENLDESTCFSILSTCKRIWDLVQGHLCVDSPEFSQSEVDLDMNVGPKDILAYSWRALRDSSLLLQVLISTRPDNDLILSRIGSLCFDQLVRLRHRGAFSVVAETFMRCCTTMDDIANQELRITKSLWYSQAIEQIDLQSYRFTRRSAGLPALVACILQPSDFPAAADFFHSFIKKASSVVSAARSGETTSTIQEMPQVHAFNCLREIMTNSRFRSASQNHVFTVLELACSQLSSREWPIRNCALMLLRACLNRLNKQRDTGVMLNGDHDPSTANNSSGCVELAFNLLKTNTQLGDQRHLLGLKEEENHAEVAKTFAALDLIDRLQLSSDSFLPFRPLTTALLRSPIWAIRARAAELLAKFAGETSIMAIAAELDSLPLLTTNNLHGYLICVRLSISDTLARIEATNDTAGFSKIIEIAPWLRDIYHQEARMPHVRSEALTIINMFCECCVKLGFNDAVDFRAMLHEIFQDFMTWLKVMSQALPVTPLRAPLTLGLVLHAFSGETLASNENQTAVGVFFQTLESTDPDVFIVVLSRLRPLVRYLHTSLLNLLASLLSQNDGHAAINEVMLLTLDMLLEHHESVDTEQIERIRVALAVIEPLSREGLIAKMKLEGCLLAVAAGSATQAASARPSFDQWMVSVSFAASDLIDLPTRTAAAESLHVLISLSVAKHAVQWLDNDLDVLILLYDLALDDDEDVRESAAQSIRELLGHCPGGPLTPCPLAARRNILHHLRTAFMPAPQLAIIALRKMLTTDLSIARYCYRRSVSSLVNRVIRSTGDLFAEEKQNLYINELEEISIWNEVLIQASMLSLQETDREALGQWIVSGLKYVLQLLRDQHDLVTSCPFGITYNVDIQCIFARLLLLAAHFTRDRQEVNELLVELVQCLRESNAHHDILRMMDSVTTQTHSA